MAELSVLSVASKIVSGVASPVLKMAYEEARSIMEARDELHKLGVTLESIQSVLVDAEKRGQESAAITNWIKRLKGVLYDAEDLFDEVEADDLLKKQRKKRPIIDKVKSLCLNSDIAKRVKTIRKSLVDLSTDMAQFGFLAASQKEGTMMMKERDSGWAIDAKNVIGRDEDKRILLKMISDESDDPLVVITVVGIGGMGKTAIAKLLYDDEEIKQKFEERWFSCISDTSDQREVLGKIFHSISGESCTDLDVGHLLTKIKQKIEGRKYLLVLDDVWEDKKSNWKDRMSLLSCGAKGSRIIVTTRLPSVKKAMGAVGTHTLKGLSDDDSWNLFKSLAFDAECEIDPKKERLGREILKKCYGAPLAIQSMGNLLGHEDSLSKWEDIEKEGFPKVGGDYSEIMSVLKLSYDHLPSYLKHCFAYCSLFPKDEKLYKDKLMNHWTAQGYIELNDAESGFMSLLRMGFFQDVIKDEHGEISWCKMHDLMHDLAAYVAGEESVLLESKSSNNISNCARHLSVVSRTVKELGNLTWIPNAKSLRSLLLSNIEQSDGFARFKYLRMLSLNGRQITNLPDSIGELKLLRYLDLENSSITRLPDFISNLVNLESLDLENSFFFEFWPRDFNKLVKLRYLNVNVCLNLKSMPVGIEGMTSLQHLNVFKSQDACNPSAGLPPQLRGQLTVFVSEDSSVNIESWQLPVSLQHLNLYYYGASRQLPDWVTSGNMSTNNLARLLLKGCENVKYLSSLRFLPNLSWLRLDSLSGLEFVEEEQGKDIDTSTFFPCLEELQLYDLTNLKGWWGKAEPTGSSGFLELPLLRKLKVIRCPKLDLKLLPPCPGIPLLVQNYEHYRLYGECKWGYGSY